VTQELIRSVIKQRSPTIKMTKLYSVRAI